MAQMTEAEIRQSLRSILAQKRPDEVAAIAQDVATDTTIQSEANKLSVSLSLLSDADWATFKSFLMDRGGPSDYAKAFMRARTKLENDNQAAFWQALAMLFKVCRNALPHLDY